MPSGGCAPSGPNAIPTAVAGPAQHIERVDVPGGLIHEYQHAA
jgi:hypothetical protein